MKMIKLKKMIKSYLINKSQKEFLIKFGNLIRHKKSIIFLNPYFELIHEFQSFDP
jgi:hypothetical protein